MVHIYFNIIIWQQSNSAIFNILYRIMKNSLYSHRKIKYIIQTSRSKWQPYNISVPLDLKATLKDTRLILNIIYVWKLNQTVLELDFRAVKFSVTDITLECLQITPTKFRGSKFPGNMHNYIWCPYQRRI